MSRPSVSLGGFRVDTRMTEANRGNVTDKVGQWPPAQIGRSGTVARMRSPFSIARDGSVELTEWSWSVEQDVESGTGIAVLTGNCLPSSMQLHQSWLWRDDGGSVRKPSWSRTRPGIMARTFHFESSISTDSIERIGRNLSQAHALSVLQSVSPSFLLRPSSRGLADGPLVYVYCALPNASKTPGP